MHVHELRHHRAFDLLRCSWPRPVTHKDGWWSSEPEWDAPLMPDRPPLHPGKIPGAQVVDWREFFRRDTHYDLAVLSPGEMRGFHVVFTIRANARGLLNLWCDDGCIVRRRGEIIHSDRGSHAYHDEGSHARLAVEAGDELEIAQWQFWGDWRWGASLEIPASPLAELSDRLAGYREAVADCLDSPTGPPLKTYLSGRNPGRAVLALYSLILNGYHPPEVWLYGEDQWSPAARDTFARLLPFAHVVPTSTTLEDVRRLGGDQLARWAQSHWQVMKTCIALLQPPGEFCLLDDDVFVLDSLQDALDQFAGNDLVYSGDANFDAAYAQAWKTPAGATPPTRLNAGLYFARAVTAVDELAEYMLTCDPASVTPWVWEQGFITWAYSDARPTHLLSTQRYLLPMIDGLPGGFSGYDYRNNPCGFAAVHFAGALTKPDDALALVLVDDILGAHQARSPR